MTTLSLLWSLINTRVGAWGVAILGWCLAIWLLLFPAPPERVVETKVVTKTKTIVLVEDGEVNLPPVVPESSGESANRNRLLARGRGIRIETDGEVVLEEKSRQVVQLPRESGWRIGLGPTFSLSSPREWGGQLYWGYDFRRFSVGLVLGGGSATPLRASSYQLRSGILVLL